ncbi:MAG TPA: M28 family peptidase, partial [Myxococcales bacterium]|nr:M28 family peptidase [Myxococcales bacterium]
METLTPQRSAQLLGALVIVAVFVAASGVSYRAPSPKAADAPATEFSAGRARDVLRALVGDGEPHPTGSMAATRLRQRIVARLEQLGYQPELQERFACGAVRICARVTNVLARLDGTSPGKAVLLSVHYDSVPAGPAASDDGVGVAAALEVARALRTGGALKNPVFFLFNEGEENDLLGAEAFTSGHPWARQVGAVVNLEARGTTGPSLMFETSDESGWLIDLFARTSARPASNSIYYTIYKLLPNDTDLTVYKRRGLAGLNFAFIGGETRYHTPRDDFAHANPGSLQHHGDNALGMVRALAQADLDSPPRSELAFFDVLAFGIVRWPLGWMPVLAVLAALLLIAAAVRTGRRGELTAGGVAWGLAAFAASVAGTGLVGLLLSLLLRAAGAAPYAWVAHPAPLRAAFLALPVLVSGLAAMWIGRRAGSAGLWWGTWAFWAIASLATALAVPGLSYPFVLPCLVAAICELAGARRLALFLPVAVAALLWSP